VIEEERDRALRAASTADPDATADADALATLPSDEYPTLVALAQHFTSPDPEARYRFGFTVLLAGLQAYLKHEATPSDDNADT
jgi:hypothetical protein